jgi:NAD(P)-dependent dehydrogenase (short-subunit alcohol dehydrogenase family)
MGYDRRATVMNFAHEGARAIYCLDFDPTNLPDLKKTVESTYGDVRVTTIQADAADEKAIIGVCERAVKEEGRLDVFFANVRPASEAPV